MFSFRRWLFCAALAFSPKMAAAPPLTTIDDVLFTADGNRFNGALTISWPSFEAADTSNVAAETMRLQISNGTLYVQLVPTTNANTAAIYTVQYASADAQFTEAWTVPPSTLPVRVRDVRVPPGSVTGSAPPAVTLIQISDVTGLQDALNLRPTTGGAFAIFRTAVVNASGSIDGAVGNPSDCMHVDGSSATCGTGSSSSGISFVDFEAPGGTMDGTNATFTLANAPAPSLSLTLFRNGVLQRQGGDYTLTTNTISFQSGAVPQATDLLLASYRMAANVPGVGFVDAETPSGTIDGVNNLFSTAQTPNPTSSLAIYRNGLRLIAGVDYTTSGNSIAFGTAFVPQTGDSLVCSYRIAQ
jgi:hypothetical protein